ncbi:MAG: regulatory protein RecX [Bacteroidales bacterium]
MRLKPNLSEQELLHKAAAYCSTAEHCLSEVHEKLTAWGAAPDVIKRILKRLTDERFVDEERYAKAFAKDKFKFSKWGKVKIRFALQKKKINQLLIDDALENLEMENYQVNLLEILIKKRKSIKDTDYQTLKGKLFRFAASRGYETNLILQTISKILSHDSDDME